MSIRSTFPATEITKSRLIICEGVHDSAFFRALNSHYNLPESNVFNLRDLGKPTNQTWNFERALIGIRAFRGYNLLKEIILVRDSDNDETASFADVVSQIRRVPSPDPVEKITPYPLPRAPNTKESGSPSLTVMMIPRPDRKGALESLCYEAAVRRVPHSQTVIDDFMRASGADQWEQQKQDKARLRAIIAGYNQTRPDLSLGLVWLRQPALIPIDDPAFHGVRDFLASH